MSNEDDPLRAPRPLFASAVAGAVGGLAGGAVKQLCEAIVPPRSSDREAPPGILADKLIHAVNGSHLSKQRKANVALGVHYLFSVLSGAAYGATIARAPEIRLDHGVSFGVTLWTGLHEILLPLLGATPPLPQLPLGEQVNEAISHSIFGITTESVRGWTLRCWT